MPDSSEITRRDFLKSSARAGTASLAALSGVLLITQPERVFGANDRVRVAICGVRGRGFDHIREYARLPRAEIAALCDVDENVLDRRLGDVEKLGKPRPERYIDCRKVMDDKSIDAVSIATPDHWHALIGIYACQAGKDVYIEKPCSHAWWDGYQLVRAAEKYNRVVQMGAQSRSNSAVQEAIRKMREGLIGEVYLARGLCYKWRPTIGHTPVSPVPHGVHYDLWLGPAPEHPFTRNRFHYNWHWFWDYGRGDLGNHGVPAAGLATHSHAHKAGAGLGPVSGAPRTIGNIFYGSKGYLAIEGYDSFLSWLGESQEPGPRANGIGNHFANFIDAVISRRKQDLTAPIEEGHKSTMLVTLANVSYRLGRTLRFDGKTQKVIGDDEANRMLHGTFRAPFTVPETV